MDEFGNPTMGGMEPVFIGSLGPEKKDDDSDKMRMEIDQYKKPGNDGSLFVVIETR